MAEDDDPKNDSMAEEFKGTGRAIKRFLGKVKHEMHQALRPEEKSSKAAKSAATTDAGDNPRLEAAYEKLAELQHGKFRSDGVKLSNGLNQYKEDENAGMVKITAKEIEKQKAYIKKLGGTEEKIREKIEDGGLSSNDPNTPVVVQAVVKPATKDKNPGFTDIRKKDAEEHKEQEEKKPDNKESKQLAEADKKKAEKDAKDKAKAEAKAKEKADKEAEDRERSEKEAMKKEAETRKKDAEVAKKKAEKDAKEKEEQTQKDRSAEARKQAQKEEENKKVEVKANKKPETVKTEANADAVNKAVENVKAELNKIAEGKTSADKNDNKSRVGEQAKSRAMTGTPRIQLGPIGFGGGDARKAKDEFDKRDNKNDKSQKQPDPFEKSVVELREVLQKVSDKDKHLSEPVKKIRDELLKTAIDVQAARNDVSRKTGLQADSAKDKLKEVIGKVTEILDGIKEKVADKISVTVSAAEKIPYNVRMKADEALAQGMTGIDSKLLPTPLADKSKTV